MQSPLPIRLGKACCLAIILVLLAVLPTIAQPTSIEKELTKKNWQTEKISKGVVWKYYHGNGLFNSRQSINVLDINLDKAKMEASLAYSDSALIKTSELAQQEEALAAINGSFFNTKVGGSVVFLKVNGQIIDTTAQPFQVYRENGAVAIDADGNAFLMQKPATGWATVAAANMLASGPLLVYGGQEEEMVQQAFNTNRHPRTAIGFTKDNHMIAVTVDGRSSKAQGMTNKELAQLMLALDCESAMNLDGGGSTTMYIKGKGSNGIVNYPSDNKLYDHNGERAVANAIVFVLKK